MMHKPTTIILDTRQAARAFYEAILSHDIEIDLQRLAEYTVEALRFKSDPVECHLDDLIDHYVRQYEGETRPVVQRAVSAFVNVIIAQLKNLQLYDAKGVFPYHAAQWDGENLIVKKHASGKHEYASI